MANRSPRFAPYPEWTEAKFFAFLRSGLRAKWMRWPPKWEVLKCASRPYEGPDKRKKTEYRCAKCNDWYSLKDVSVDHIVPAGRLSCYEDLADFVRALFVGKEKLQVLCTTCHATKTLKERKDRASKRTESRD